MQDQEHPAKLYIVVRGDLPPGLQMAQAVHAAFEFAHQHRDISDPWLVASNYLVIVSVPDEGALQDITVASTLRGIPSTLVREPDIGNEATALALAPVSGSRQLCAMLPLALRHAMA